MNELAATITGSVLWAAVAVMATIGGGLIVSTWKMARAAGRLEAKVDELVNASDDHEERIRDLERGSRWPQRGRPAGR